MNIFDSHLHLFSRKIIDNVSRKKEMVAGLNLQTHDAAGRSGISALTHSLQTAGVSAGLLLPTAGPSGVDRVNKAFLEKAASTPFLYTAGTLHPDYPHNRAELERLCRHGVRGIKLCSFSQGFELDAPSTLALFDLIRNHNLENSHHFFVVLDTFYHAHEYFGTDPAHTTTPSKFSRLAGRYPDINFIGAHMGGLTAPFESIYSHLSPCDNLYLDTSNAAHTLTSEEFIGLLKRFGPQQIVFGTDWPWFVHRKEIPVIQKLLGAAGFSPKEMSAVFYENMASLLEI